MDKALTWIMWVLIIALVAFLVLAFGAVTHAEAHTQWEKPTRDGLFVGPAVQRTLHFDAARDAFVEAVKGLAIKPAPEVDFFT